MKPLTGRIDVSRIKAMTLPPITSDIIARFRSLGDISCAVSDALDDLGVPGAIAGSTLRPTIPGARLVGRALTMRNVVKGRDPMAAARAQNNTMAELEAHNLAEPDDVIVIQGLLGTSNMGGVAAQVGKRQGEAGAIIDGGVRDVGHSRSVGYPIWSVEVTPRTGKWRVETAEINGPVAICGVTVNPGDLVVADDTGVCFVPHEHIAAVLEFAIKKAKSEDAAVARVEAGLSVPELAGGGKPKT